MEALKRALELTMWKGAIESSWQKLIPKCTTVVLTTVLLRELCALKAHFPLNVYILFKSLTISKIATTVDFFTTL